MIAMLVCLCFAADVDPDALYPNAKEYFRRAEIAREQLQEEFKTRKTDLEIAIRGTSVASEKVKLKRELILVEKSAEELKRSKVTAYFPQSPSLNDIGAIRPATITAVIDDRWAIVQEPGKSFVLFVPDTKGLKVRRTLQSDEIWYVFGTKTENEEILERVGQPYYLVTPLKRGTIEKLRLRYEAERKAAKPDPAPAAAPPGAVEPAKPPLKGAAPKDPACSGEVH